MKQCPKCRQLFAGGDLRYCRYDGFRLISEANPPPDEAVTIPFPTGPINHQLTPLEDLHRGSKSGKLSR